MILSYSALQVRPKRNGNTFGHERVRAWQWLACFTRGSDGKTIVSFGSSIPPLGVLVITWLEAVTDKRTVTTPKETGVVQCRPLSVGALMKTAKMNVMLGTSRAPGREHKDEDADPNQWGR